MPIFAAPGPNLFRTPGFAEIDPAACMAMGKRADELGYDSLWVADHLMLGKDDAILEGWTVLSALAGATTRAKLGMIHLAVLFRNPALTAKMVANVRSAWEKNRFMYDKIFTEVNNLTLEAAKAIKRYDLEKLGDYMNINQGLLNALQVSSWELEELIQIARKAGALGAKLTGGGGGGAMIALCPGNADAVVEAMRKAGYRALIANIG